MLKEDRETLKAGLSPHFEFDDLKNTITKIRGISASERWGIERRSGRSMSGNNSMN